MSILTISEAKKLCARCDRCALGKTRTNVVFGSGTGASGVMVVGEAPGANEDKEGKPFVGAAGDVLDNHLGYLRVLRNSLYITNTVKCRPPRNRQPSEDEVLACKPFLDTQIGRYKPKVLVLLGKTAAERFGIHGSMAKLHGRLYEVDGYDMPCFVTYHPASCIYKPSLSTTIAADFSALAENVGTVDDRFDEAMGAVISCMESVAETEAYTNLVKNSKLLRAGYFFTEPEFTAAVDVLMADVPYSSLIKKKKADNINVDNFLEIVLCQVPSVSSVTASVIASSYGSLPYLLSALQEDRACLDKVTLVDKSGKSRKISKTAVANIVKYLLHE